MQNKNHQNQPYMQTITKKDREPSTQTKGEIYTGEGEGVMKDPEPSEQKIWELHSFMRLYPTGLDWNAYRYTHCYDC